MFSLGFEAGVGVHGLRCRVEGIKFAGFRVRLRASSLWG